MPEIGDPAPPVSGVDVLSGQPFDLSDHAGKVNLVIFSGITWCGPCQFEAPVLADLWEEFKVTLPPAVQFVMVSVQDEDDSKLIQAANLFGITYPIIRDTAAEAAYEVTGVPALFFIGTDGKICAIDIGAGGTVETTKEQIRQELLTCGAGQPVDLVVSDWVAVATILFGVTQDGGGLVITPGGKPIPIDPWGPLRRLSRGEREALMALAVGKLASNLGDARNRRQAQQAALSALQGATRRMRLELERSVAPEGPNVVPVRSK